MALHLTEAGRARAREVVEGRCLAPGEFVDVFSPEQRAQLDAIAETLLRAMTRSAAEAGHICRLCDVIACPEDRCPVHQAALALPGQPTARLPSAFTGAGVET